MIDQNTFRNLYRKSIDRLSFWLTLIIAVIVGIELYLIKINPNMYLYLISTGLIFLLIFFSIYFIFREKIDPNGYYRLKKYIDKYLKLDIPVEGISLVYSEPPIEELLRAGLPASIIGSVMSSASGKTIFQSVGNMVGAIKEASLFEQYILIAIKDGILMYGMILMQSPVLLGFTDYKEIVSVSTKKKFLSTFDLEISLRSGAKLVYTGQGDTVRMIETAVNKRLGIGPEATNNKSNVVFHKIINLILTLILIGYIFFLFYFGEINPYVDRLGTINTALLLLLLFVSVIVPKWRLKFSNEIVPLYAKITIIFLSLFPIWGIQQSIADMQAGITKTDARIVNVDPTRHYDEFKDDFYIAIVRTLPSNSHRLEFEFEIPIDRFNLLDTNEDVYIEYWNRSEKLIRIRNISDPEPVTFWEKMIL